MIGDAGSTVSKRARVWSTLPRKEHVAGDLGEMRGATDTPTILGWAPSLEPPVPKRLRRLTGATDNEGM